MKILQRNGFGLIQALFVIVLVGGMVSLALRYAKVSIHRTDNSYEKQSAKLFLNSAIELSLLAISGYDRKDADNCLKDIKIISKEGRFIAHVHIKWYYLLKGSKDAVYCSNNTNLTHIIDTEDSQGMAMIEAEVDSNNTNPKNGTNLRITRRTLQKL